MGFNPRMIPLVLLLVCGGASADAGYLGAPLQNASPLVEHPTITMSAEEVVIELLGPEIDGRHLAEEESWELEWEEQEVYNPGAEVDAAFLFTNDGPAETVTMYVPLAVRHPFYGPYLWIEDEDAAMSWIEIYVDGERVEPYPVYRGVWDPDDYRQERTWDVVAPLIDPLCDEEPEPGESFLFYNGEAQIGTDSPNPAHAPESLLAAWEVEFDAGGERLVEYHQTYDFSMDYMCTSFRLCYPLYTGAGWAGDIGRGRIAVVGDERFEWDMLTEALGLYLPPPVTEKDYKLVFDPPFDEAVLLREHEGRYDDALVWEFTGLEPVGGLESWKTFSPDFGDIYNADYDEWREARDIGADPPEDGRHATLVYLALYEKADHFLVIENSAEGLQLFNTPDGKPLERRASYGNYLNLLDSDGDWLRVSWRPIDSDSDDNCEGWLPLTVVDEDGLVCPRIMPLF